MYLSELSWKDIITQTDRQSHTETDTQTDNQINKPTKRQMEPST